VAAVGSVLIGSKLLGDGNARLGSPRSVPNGLAGQPVSRDRDNGAVRVRPATPPDAAALAAIYSEGIEGHESTFETRPRTAGEMRARIETPGEIHLVAGSDGDVIGWAGTAVYSTREAYAGVAEASVYVLVAARGRGVGTALAEALAAEARRRGMHKLVGKLFTENEASRRLVARCGFREVGVHLRHGQLDGSWRDVLVVELLLSSEEPEQAQ
jgi:L-amino acid N-acyltransferase YncA